MKKLYFLFIALIAGSSAFAQTLPNSGMETWRTGTSGSTAPVNIAAPIQWYGFDSLAIALLEGYGPLIGHPTPQVAPQVFEESTIIHGGSHSAKLMTRYEDTLGYFAGILSNAVVNINVGAIFTGGSIASAITFSGGTPITRRVASVSAWVQYTAGKDTATHLTGIDSGLFTVTVYALVHGVDSAVGNATVTIGPSTSFQQITANVVYNDTLDGADTIRMTFASSGQAGALDSSTLYVDDVTMTYITIAGVKNVNGANEVVKVYPNPASGMLYLEGSQSEGSNFQLYSMNGQVVAAKTLTGKDVVDVSYLPEGLYFYTITDKSNGVQRGKVSVVR